MIVFRQVDATLSFPVEDSRQRRAAALRTRGPLSTTSPTRPTAPGPNSLRHEEITDPADIATIRRQMWVVDIWRRDRRAGHAAGAHPHRRP